MRARWVVLIASAAAIAAVVALVAGGGHDQRVTAAAEPGGTSQGASTPAGSATADSQRAAVPDPGPAARTPGVQSRAGHVVARGQHYVIEDVPLDAPATVTVAGKTQTATSVLRITITAGQLQVR